MDADIKIKDDVVSEKHVIVFDHARIDSSHCLTDGLFRPLKKESLKGKSLDVSYKYKDYTFRWLNYCPLGIFDQTVFIAIHRLASEHGQTTVVGATHNNPTMLEVRNALMLEQDAANSDCLVLETSLYRIAKTMGMSTGGTNLKLIKDSLIKLSCVSFIIYRDDDFSSAFWKANLFSRLAGMDGKIVVGINPMLSKALSGGQSTFVSMEEQRVLQTDVSRRLHVWLSSWMKAGETRKVDRELLIPHVWGDVVFKEALRSRRFTLRKALKQINDLEGWSCVEDTETNKVTITRPFIEKS